MEYIYLPETYASSKTKYDLVLDLDIINLECKLQYICYHISYIDNYPFLQILLNCNEKKLELPFINIGEDDECTIDNISGLLITDVKNRLTKLHCDVKDLTSNSFKGIFRDTDNNIYGLVNINNINIKYLNLSTYTKSWFVLPSEIVNIHTVCNIPISEDVIELFTYDITQLAVLKKPNLVEIYTSPDVVYTGSEYTSAGLEAIFGPDKKHIYDMNIPHYAFCNLFKNAVLHGGWVQNNKSTINNNKIDNKYGRYMKGGITRYALFMKNVVFIDNSVFINKLVNYESYDSIIIKSEAYKQDVLVKNFEQFIPLSYHMLNKDTLGEQYDNKIHDKYEIV